MLIQTLWLQRIDWDQTLREEDVRAWHRLQSELPLLERLRMPRWFYTSQPNTMVELHGFADASERAYAAVVYLRVNCGDDWRVTLLQAKTKVASLKQVSIPRLELCVAVLLVKVVEHLLKILEIHSIPIHLWSDSTVTLAWIQGHPSKWKTYVANRTAEIQRALPDALWHHLPGEENPADCAYRGLLPSELLSHPLWWQGPTWLRQGNWPCHPNQPVQQEVGELPEQRRVHLATTPTEENQILLRFSTLNRLLRVTAWCRRWLSIFRSRHDKSVSGTLTSQDLEETQRMWIKEVQALWYEDELKAVSQGKTVPNRSSLLKLTPFLDDHGLLRVGGRLKHAILSHDERHPIILPQRSHLTTLLVDAYHRRTLHGGVQLTLGLLRQRHWIPGGRQVVK